MLVLARAQKLDLAKLSMRDFVVQLTGALRRTVPINQKAEWVGMATWVVLLRSRLLIPVSPAANLNAKAEAQTLQARLVALQEMPSALAETEHQLHVIEFLWATIELTDDADADTEAIYRPFYIDIHKVSEAREQILWRLVKPAERQFLQDLAPAAAGHDAADAKSVRRYKSGWTTAFTAALEMAKQGEIILPQKNAFEHSLPA